MFQMRGEGTKLHAARRMERSFAREELAVLLLKHPCQRNPTSYAGYETLNLTGISVKLDSAPCGEVTKPVNYEESHFPGLVC